MLVRFINGRYVDRLEKRDGEWKIALRRCTLDFMIEGDASMLKSRYISAGRYVKGQGDRSDVSYQPRSTMVSTWSGYDRAPGPRIPPLPRDE